MEDFKNFFEQEFIATGCEEDVIAVKELLEMFKKTSSLSLTHKNVKCVIDSLNLSSVRFDRSSKGVYRNHQCIFGIKQKSSMDSVFIQAQEENIRLKKEIQELKEEYKKQRERLVDVLLETNLIPMMSKLINGGIKE